jgi:uncharacterized protein (TIGR02444 family)
MDNDSGPDSFQRFALDLYGSAGVAAACLHLQNRHALDVNLVLLAAFVGAARQQMLTPSVFDAAHDHVDAWHHEVVRPLRAVRQRLKTGPLPAPSPRTTGLRQKLQQLEIEAEMIELAHLGAFIGHAHTPQAAGSAAECGATAIQAVIEVHTGATLDDADHRAIDTIAAAAARPPRDREP